MIHGLIGKKVGMTHLFASEARVIPVTVLEVGPCVVTQVRTKQRDGYEAVQVGFGRAKQLNEPARGHLKKSGAQSRILREFKVDDVSDVSVGDTLPVTQFQPGDVVDVTARSKGRGFQGAVKRHGFGGGRKTHGQGDRYRAVGSIGGGTFPGRVPKGKKMPGHMGAERVTMRKLVVEQVDPVRNLLMVRGAVPGVRDAYVTISYTKGAKVSDRLTEEQWAELLGTPIPEEAPAEPEEAAPEAVVAEAAPEEAVEEPAAEESTVESAAGEPVAETEEPAAEPAAEEAAEEPKAEAEQETSAAEEATEAKPDSGDEATEDEGKKAD